jgi:hypothetical protein
MVIRSGSGWHVPASFWSWRRFGFDRFVAGFLYGVAPTDVLTYSAVALLLIGVAAAAGYQPARAATPPIR